MKTIKLAVAILVSSSLITSCVSKKKYSQLKSQHELEMTDLRQKYKMEEEMKETCRAKNDMLGRELSIRTEQIAEYKERLKNQLEQVDGLTVLSKSANDNIKETLTQLEEKDEYIKYLQEARSKADSINLALAVNLKGALEEGIADKDVNIEVDKTVVFINISDEMLYKSGSYALTDRANEVLGKIAKIVKSRPNFEVMVEGYTDNRPISRAGIKDNWDLSVLRATSVVRELEEKHDVNPDRLIAAGRGDNNAIASNATKAGRAENRRTRIIILPELDKFYDLLDPDMASK